MPRAALASSSSPSARSCFLAISALLARYLTTENAERNAIYDLLRAQARGDGAAMASAIAGCRARPSCQRQTRDLARRLRRPAR